MDFCATIKEWISCLLNPSVLDKGFHVNWIPLYKIKDLMFTGSPCIG